MASQPDSLPILAVVGACGKQGGSLISAILSHSPPSFRLRGLTRKPQSKAAQDLVASGVEMVNADLDDLESLIVAFEGAAVAFCVTNFWDHMTPDRETQQAHNMAEAARSCRLSHVIWSTLEDTRSLASSNDPRTNKIPPCKAGYMVPHFDAKGQADKVFDGVPTTFLRTSFYFDNLLEPAFGMVHSDAEGALLINLPLGSHKIPAFAVSDMGPCALAILRDPDQWIGKTVGLAGQFISGIEMADALEVAVGIPCRYQAIDYDTYRSLPFPAAHELGNMYQFYCEFEKEFCNHRVLSIGSHQNLSFTDFLHAHQAQLCSLFKK